MSFPFFQGNVNDLLEVAGAGQGSFILGQLMRAQQEQQKADLQKTLLANITQEAEAKRRAEMHPLEMEGKRADINYKNVSTDSVKEQIAEAARKGQIFEATGGAQGAARRISVEDQKKLAEAYDKLREAYEDAVMTMPHSGNMQDQIMRMGTDLQLPQNFVENMIGAARSPESWKSFQDTIFSNSRRGREQAARTAADRETKLAIEKERTDRAIRTAEIRAASARNQALKRNFENAATEMMFAAEAAREAGDIEKAQKYEEMANKFAMQAQAEIARREAERRAGGIDPGRTAQGGGVATHPQATPTVPYPRGGGQPAIRFERGPDGKPVRVQ